MNSKDVKTLLDLVADTDVTDLLVVNADGTKIRIRRGPQAMVAPQVVPTAPQALVGPAATATAAGGEVPVAADEDDKSYVTSPFVGTFYLAASPDSPPFVEVGSKVSQGQTLCIVEAMKIMNEIESEVSGTVTEVLAENGQPVEFGQRLFRIS